MDIFTLSALQLAGELQAGSLRIKDVLDTLFARIEEQDKHLRCYITLCKNEAYARAEIVQAQLDAGKAPGALAGVPIALKDNISTKGIPTTCASKILEGYVPIYNAHVVDLLEAAGLIIIGKVNMDECAMGATTETSAYGITANPWDLTRVPGGSSGGSAAAVSADLAFLALGTDTGGSIRQPSAFCGVMGLKPTYGSVSRRGAIAFASSLDQVGPVARDAADCAALYQILRQRDPLDATSMDCAPFALEDVTGYSLKGKKIGLPREYFGEGTAADVRARVLAAAETMRSLGAQVEEFDMPIVKYAIPTYYILSCAEGSSNLSRYDGIKYGYCASDAENLLDTYIKTRSEGFGMEVKRRIMLGNFVLSSGYYDAYYNKALQAKKLIQEAFNNAFETYDFLLTPVAPQTAPKQGESLQDPLKMYMGDIDTVIVNIAGLPALSTPCGLDENGLPVGLQLIGKAFDEAQLLGAAYAYQQNTNFHLAKPPVNGGAN